jgi:hypothetical protein
LSEPRTTSSELLAGKINHASTRRRKLAEIFPGKPYVAQNLCNYSALHQLAHERFAKQQMIFAVHLYETTNIIVTMRLRLGQRYGHHADCRTEEV